MKRILIVVVLAGALAALAGCPKGGSVPQNARDCRAAGGHWQQGDSHHRPFCQPPKGGTW